jgi:hypothetical protein
MTVEKSTAAYIFDEKTCLRVNGVKILNQL